MEFRASVSVASANRALYVLIISIYGFAPVREDEGAKI